MKLLYIVPNINNEGGVARVISIKTNYLIEKWNYKIDILTQNKGNSPLFYTFNSKIKFLDIILKGNLLRFLILYRKQLNQKLKDSKPDIIIVCDNGIKSLIIPFILNTKIPIIYECHSSKNVEEFGNSNYISSKIKSIYKSLFIKKYKYFVGETPNSLIEWNVKNGIVIPNSLWFSSNNYSKLNSKKIIAVGRHVYEKGFDRLLNIWQKVNLKHPEWCLEIYGSGELTNDLKQQTKRMKIETSVSFFEPIKNIQEKYLESSIFLMTSRFEGFGMVLLEAMESGLPSVVYDCPVGPKSLINNTYNGFLIENNNENDYVDTVCKLISNENLRVDVGRNAKQSSKSYQIDPIMEKWNELFLKIKL